MAPGLWRNSDYSDTCYWERLSGFSWEFRDLVVNDISDSIQTVQIDAMVGIGDSVPVDVVTRPTWGHDRNNRHARVCHESDTNPLLLAMKDPVPHGTLRRAQHQAL